MSASFDLPEPDRLTAGTVGPAGARTFYLQARQGERLVTLKLEKQQVGALAQLLVELLADLSEPGPLPDPATLELEEPVLAEWVVGSMQLSWDAGADRIVLLAEEGGSEAGNPDAGDPEAGESEAGGSEAGDPDAGGSEAGGSGPGGSGATDLGPRGAPAGPPAGEGAIGRLAFTRAQAAALAARSEQLVAAGRPPCPLCGYPLDPAGHSCPKTNGHRAPTL